MRLVSMTIEGFRCFKNSTTIIFDDLTTLIGQNDVGKSSICCALDAFFNNTIDFGDYSLPANGELKASITCEFNNLPEKIVIDDTWETNFEDEHLLNRNGNLCIRKDFTGKKPKSEVYIICNYPKLPNYNEILSLKITDLKTYAKKNDVSLEAVNQTVKSEIRRAIFTHFKGVDFQEVSISTGQKEDANSIAKKIEENYMPAFYLFKADRQSSDQDAEAQDPLKLAVKEALAEQKKELERISDAVKEKLREIAAETVSKLEEMDPTLAKTLKPNISEPQWANIFKISLDDQDDIPVNKRGSGVRRLVLLNFFRAQVERNVVEGQDVIVAVEEPETSLHPDKQKMLIKALYALTKKQYQVILTTHSPALASLLPESSIRYICHGEDGRSRKIDCGKDCIEAAAAALGILPNNKIKLFIGVEGPHDESFLCNISRALSKYHGHIVNIEKHVDNGEIVFILLGGSTIQLWVNRLAGLKIREFYICDRDSMPGEKAHYEDFASEVNARDGACCFMTDKREMENYIHFEAINSLREGFFDEQPGDFEKIPHLVAQKTHERSGATDTWEDLPEEKKKKKISAAKKFLNNEAAAMMSYDLLKEVDKEDFIFTCFEFIKESLKK